MGNICRKILKCGKFTPICHTKYGLLLYRREKLYLMDPETHSKTYVCDFPMISNRKLLCFCDFTTRLMHLSVYCGIEVEGGALIAANRGIYFLDFNEKHITREHTFEAAGMMRPLQFYRIQGIEGFQDEVVYGEYSGNSILSPVKIWARTSEGCWVVRYEFPANTIRHIHSIVCDVYRQRVIICTGDLGEEVGIWCASDGFQRVARLFGGKQLYRACCARAYPEGVIFATDSPYDQNYLFEMVEESGEPIVRKIANLAGPVVFFANVGEKLVFATNVENDGRNRGLLGRYLSYNKGAGVLDWYVHLYQWAPLQGLSEIAKFKKDIWPMSAFGFGNIILPSGTCTRGIYFQPTAVSRYNEMLCYIKL